MIDYQILRDIITDHELCPVQKRELEKVIAKLQSTGEDAWIPCSERLPEKEGAYLTSRMTYEGYEIEIFTFNPKDDLDVVFWEEEIDAWMSLPAPYEENNMSKAKKGE